MKWISYSRYTGEDLGLSSEDLMRALSDFFLQSGFEYQYMSFSEMDKHSLERLKEASGRLVRWLDGTDPPPTDLLESAELAASVRFALTELPGEYETLLTAKYLDGDSVEEASQAAVGHEVPVYIIGRQSLFGHGRLTLNYIDPVTKDNYWVTIRRWPETADFLPSR